MVLEDIIRKGYNWRLLYLEDGTLIKVKVNDINVRNVEGNSKLNSQNAGVNSAITPIK